MAHHDLPAALALSLLVAPAAEEIAHGAEEDTELVRTYASTIELELVEFRMTVNGEEFPEDLLPEFEMTTTHEEIVVVRDVFGPPADGRPESLVRTFETLEGLDSTSGNGLDGEALDEELELSSELDGRTVVFTWDEDQEEYAVAFDDDDADEELLEDLVEDMDLRGFLPDEEVEQGDSWQVDVAAFDQLGGGVDLLAEDDEPEDEELDRQLEDNLDGEIEATFTGVREQDGVRLAVIWIAAELSTEGEQTEELDGADVLMEVTLTMELEGELLWNLEAGHLHAFALGGTLEMRQAVSGTEELDGELFEFAQELVFAGNTEITIEVERE